MNCSTLVGGKIACKRPAKFEVMKAIKVEKGDPRKVLSKHCDEHSQRIFADYLAFGNPNEMLAVRTL